MKNYRISTGTIEKIISKNNGNLAESLVYDHIVKGTAEPEDESKLINYFSDIIAESYPDLEAVREFNTLEEARKFFATCYNYATKTSSYSCKLFEIEAYYLEELTNDGYITIDTCDQFNL